MKTFIEQLQDYVNISRRDKLNRHKFMKHERSKLLSNMFDLLIALGVVKEVKSSNPFIAGIGHHQALVYALVDKYYKDP